MWLRIIESVPSRQENWRINIIPWNKASKSKFGYLKLQIASRKCWFAIKSSLDLKNEERIKRLRIAANPHQNRFGSNQKCNWCKRLL